MEKRGNVKLFRGHFWRLGDSSLIRLPALLILLATFPILSGCLSERSFPMVWQNLVRLDPAQAAPGGKHLSTRQWTAVAQSAGEHLLPPGSRTALTTDQLSTDGHIVDVWKFFGVNPAHVDSLFYSLDGIEQSAQVTSPRPANDQDFRVSWPGFVEVEVPVSQGAILYGQLGSPDPSAASTPKDFIIMTHGLFGTLGGLDVMNNCQALRRSGHYVLAIEMRGHGQTLLRHPEYAISFGVRESVDLLMAAHWLKDTQGAKRVGLLSYSLTGFEALLAAWLDGAAPNQQLENMPMLADLPPPRPASEPAFNAGMMIISAPVDIRSTADEFESPHSLWDSPVKSSFQDRARERMAASHSDAPPSMWEFAKGEFQRMGLIQKYPTYADFKRDFLRFADLHADDWQEGVRRMECIRNPVLILSAANDPLAIAQDTADLFGRVKNPNIGVVLLQGGGHMGLAAVSADYFYSVMINYFDPRTAPAPQAPLAIAKSQ